MNAPLKSTSIAEAMEALISSLSPDCERVSPVGQLPVKSPAITEIRLLAVPKVESPAVDRLKMKLQLLQKVGAIIPGEGDYFRFNYLGASYPSKLTISSEEAWFARMVQATSGRDLQITLATAAKNMGMKWIPAKGGFEEVKTGRMRLVNSEEKVFETVKMPFIPPEKRNRWPVFSFRESGLPPILTKEQMREWAMSVPWTDTMCGGEYHQYTFRTSGDEWSFVHIAECIRELGYDGKYLRRKWRYLDLDGQCYFTWGSSIETTSLMNRKELRQEETPWARNPEPWIPFKERKES